MNRYLKPIAGSLISLFVLAGCKDEVYTAEQQEKRRQEILDSQIVNSLDKGMTYYDANTHQGIIYNSQFTRDQVAVATGRTDKVYEGYILEGEASYNSSRISNRWVRYYYDPATDLLREPDRYAYSGKNRQTIQLPQVLGREIVDAEIAQAIKLIKEAHKADLARRGFPTTVPTAP